MRIFILFFLSLFFLNAQIPNGYYNSAENTPGTELKDKLHNIIDNHTTKSYSAAYDILEESDVDPNNSNNVILIYSGESVNGPNQYNGGSGWNREHVWAKSRGDFGNIAPEGTDIHNLRACNINLNSTRNNYSFDNCDTNCNQSFGNYYSGSARVFEPRDQDKGDVARIIFYMEVRYEGGNGEEDLEMTNDILFSNNEPRHGVRSTLLEWHELDPVDDFERNRNDVIYSYQGNRNPFIDHPDLVDYIWGDQQQQVWNSSLSIANNSVEKIPHIPNPIRNSYLEISPSINANTIEIYNTQGKQMSQSPGTVERIKMPTISGVYFLRFVFDQTVVNKRIVVKAL